VVRGAAAHRVVDDVNAVLFTRVTQGMQRRDRLQRQGNRVEEARKGWKWQGRMRFDNNQEWKHR
jgi:hypothetical protein